MPKHTTAFPKALQSREKLANVPRRVVFDDAAALNLLPFRPGAIEGIVFKPLITHRDGRGSLVELFRTDELPADVHPAMAYLSETLPGATRGPHEHLQQTDCFCFLPPGEFYLYLWDNRPESPTYLCHEVAIVGGDRPMTVLVPPGVVHAYRNVSAVAGLVINGPNRLYRGEGRVDPVDEIRHEDDPKSVFQLIDAI